jgi:hypothetical protein
MQGQLHYITETLVRLFGIQKMMMMMLEDINIHMINLIELKLLNLPRVQVLIIKKRGFFMMLKI